MGDLEDQWNALPVGEPPADDVLRAGRRLVARRRRRRQAVAALGGIAALAGSFLIGVQVASDDGTPGGGDPGSGQPPVAFEPVSFQGNLSPAGSCDDLLASYVDRGLGLVGPWGWQRYGYFSQNLFRSALWDDGVLGGLKDLPTAANGRAPYEALHTDRVTSSDTGTNVQEEQVDEPDTVKTDGELLVRLRGSDLLTYDVSGEHVRELSALTLTGVENGEILLSGDTVVVAGADRRSRRLDWTGERAGSRVLTVSLADPAAPEVASDVTYDGTITSLRQQGDTFRLVLSAGLPDLGFVQPHQGLTRRDAERRNRRLVAHSTIRDWLPQYDAGDGRQDLVDCADVALPPDGVGLDTAAVVTFSADAPTSPRGFGLAGAVTIAYQSADRLYLASSPTTWWGVCRGCWEGDGIVSGGTSYLFEFELTDDQAVHVASGEVEGTIRDRWSIDEAGGQLRVLVGPSSETGAFNSVVTFTRKGNRLVEDGRLDRIGGRWDEIKSVRWQDDLAIVVTFRQVDPLYVIDLRGKPRILSELRVPGYSAYLHPLGGWRLVGVGYGPQPRRWGAQLGLFGVRDLTRVRQLDTLEYGGGTTPLAAYDPRSFTWLPEHRTVLTVIQKGRVGWLSIVRLHDQKLHNRMVKVEYGSDIDQVRTLGLPNGRVALVTGEEVRFLNLRD